MADQFTYAKLPSDPCLTEEQMLAYIDGKLSAADQHACEKHIADCALCEDALEGLMLVKDRSVLAVPLKTATPSEGPKVIPIRSAGGNKKIWYAAAAVLVVMLTSVFFMQQFAETDSALAESQSADTFKNADAVPPSPTATGDTVMVSRLEQEQMIAKHDQALSEKSAEGVADPVINAPRSIVNEVEEAPAQPEIAMEMDEVLFDFGDDGDKKEEAKDASKLEQTATEGDHVVQEEEYREPESEKVTFWDRTKATIPQGNAGAGADKQKLVVDENKKTRSNDLGNVPASPQTTATGAADVPAETQNDSTASGGINLELSYQNGMNLLNAGQANAAIAMFDEVLLDKNHPRYEDAEFQKANALIKANRKPEAKTLLQAIEAKKGKYAVQAADLLKTL